MIAPCGTLSAFKRHRRNKEPVDGPCQKAADEHNAARRKAREVDTGNAYCRQMDEALERRPPVIVWHKRPDGVQVAVLVDDPHTEGGANVKKKACSKGHEFTPENTYVRADGTRECRSCKKRHNDARKAAA